MRIIKYVFLLLLLAVVAVSVYVATQKGDFNVKRSIVIDVPRTILFNYVNDYKNWEDWGSWKEDDPKMQFSYPDNTVGLGGSYTWSGSNGNGKMITVFVKENDSIAQKSTVSDNESKSYMTFKDTVGKTKITWNSEGSVSFMTKVYATFSGGVNQMMEEMQERSLNNLSKVIAREITTFDVKVNGISQKPGTFYLKQSTTCSTSEVPNRVLLMLPKLINFFKNNNIQMNGSPFVLYDNIDNANNTVTFSICGPLTEEIFISDGSDVSVAWLDPFTALKVTLTGDYSHRSEARKKGVDYLLKNNIEQNYGLPKIDVYAKSAIDVRYPSKWVTELLIPVKGGAFQPIAPLQPVTPISTVPSNAVPTATVPKPVVNKPVNPSSATTSTVPKPSVPAKNTIPTTGTQPAKPKPTTVSNPTSATKPTVTNSKPAPAKPVVPKSITPKPAASKPATPKPENTDEN